MEYKWCAVDCEGDVGNKGLLGCAFYHDSLAVYLTDHNAIKDQLTELARDGYTFIAHNAEYELSVLFWQLDIPMKAVYYNGRFNRAEWRYHSKKRLCQMWDTLALSGGLSLASLGKALHMEKYPTPQKLLGTDPNKYQWQCEKHSVWECEECYAVRDAEICWHYMTDLTATCRGWGVDPHRRLSGLACHVWRQLDSPQPVKLNDRKAIELARAAYHGGRVETFKLGTVNPCYTADVTSMYPAVMAETAFPSPDHMSYVERPQDMDVVLECEGVSHCEIFVPPMYLPPLPHVYKGELHYPVGTLNGYWTHHELRYALSLGCRIKRIYRSAFAMESVYPFPNFVNVLWTMRQEYLNSDDPRSLFAKLLMNNLYGYFGMRAQMERNDIYLWDKGKHISTQPKTAWYTEHGKLFLTYDRNQPSTSKWTNVLWAAQITAAARVKLHRYMLMQGSNLLYCDTDSVFSRAPIIGAGVGLGQLKHDGDYQGIIISAPKLYALQEWSGEWRAKAKGVARSVALQFLREGVVTFPAPVKPRSQKRRGILAGTWIDVTRTFQHVPARRQPMNPLALYSDSDSSDTSPLVVYP